MKKLLAVFLATVVQVSAFAQDAPLRNIAGDFATMWDATRNMPMTERAAAFEKSLVAQYPDFYAASRYGGAERRRARLTRSIEGFGTIRETYLEKVHDFGDAMPRHVATFRVAFPDFRLATPTWLLHSLGEMDGGTRDFDGRTDLIFGADMMATLHANEDVAPLFHHELFHTYHEPKFACSSDAIWKHLWEEGLAVYVSQALNPHATPSELLLDFPKGMWLATKAQLPAAWAHLETVLDRTDGALYSELFTTSQSSATLPVRRGYYLGYLIAQEASKSHDLSTLAHMDCEHVQILVRDVVHRQWLASQRTAL